MALGKTHNATTEEIVSVALAPSVKRDLGRVSTYNSRTMRRQAAIYISRGVAKDIKKIR